MCAYFMYDKHMIHDLGALKRNFQESIKKARDIAALLRLETEYVGRRGKLTGVLRSLKDKNEEERRVIGKAANELKKYFKESLDAVMRELNISSLGDSLHRDRIDVTAPGIAPERGVLHPLTLITRQIIDIFGTMGFAVAEGPEVETEWYNFDALNIPADHPAREMWDTFWLRSNQRLLMRTHTSPVQIRFMQSHQPPFKIISPGKVFRYEATDASHDIQFWQVEGLAVGKEVSIANFKSTIETFFEQLFHADVEIRLRPSYFPFTEPSFEVDMRMRGDQAWMEIAGAGMVHPEVLRNCGINPHEWQGFAFGMGIDRLAMLKYKIPDIRLFRENDLRFLKQFR